MRYKVKFKVVTDEVEAVGDKEIDAASFEDAVAAFKVAVKSADVQILEVTQLG